MTDLEKLRQRRRELDIHPWELISDWAKRCQSYMADLADAHLAALEALPEPQEPEPPSGCPQPPPRSPDVLRMSPAAYKHIAFGFRHQDGVMVPTYSAGGVQYESAEAAVRAAEGLAVVVTDDDVKTAMDAYWHDGVATVEDRMRRALVAVLASRS